MFSSTTTAPREALLNIHQQEKPTLTPNCLTTIYNGTSSLTGNIISCVTIPCCCFSPIKIIPQNHEGLLTRFGIFQQIYPPGVYSYNICTEDIRIISLKQKTLPIKNQKIMTNDNLTIYIDAVCFYKIHDSYKACFSVENYSFSVENLSKGVLRTVISENTLDTLFKDRTKINERMSQLLLERAVKWGIDEISIDIKDIVIPKDLQRVMAKTAEISQDANSKIISAEGEKKAAEIMVQVSKMLKDNPEAMKLLWFNTLKDISKEKSNTIVVSESINEKFVPASIMKRD